MKKLDKPILLTSAIIILLFGLIVYIKIWEAIQTEIELENVIIVKIQHYEYSGDLHWHIKGYRIYIKGDERPIDFPEKKWDASIKIKERVTLIVRRSFFGDELDGLQVRKEGEVTGSSALDSLLPKSN